MGHVRYDDQLRTGLAHHSQQTHHVRVATKLGQQCRLSEEVLLHLVVSIICGGGWWIDWLNWEMGWLKGYEITLTK